MRERSLLERSAGTERALTQPRPRLRGLSHRLAALVAVPGAVVWTLTAPPGRPRVAVAAFAFGMAVMLVASALLHARPWRAAVHERLLRLDHTGIFLAIGGSGVAVALLGLRGWPSLILFGGVVVGVTAGITLEWLPFAPPRGFSNTIYLTLGWIPVLLLPWLWMTSGVVAVALLMLGGGFYTVGAVIVGLRRPDPSPRWFGYHEVFHALVLAALATHAVLVARLVAATG